MLWYVVQSKPRQEERAQPERSVRRDTVPEMGRARLGRLHAAVDRGYRHQVDHVLVILGSKAIYY